MGIKTKGSEGIKKVEQGGALSTQFRSKEERRKGTRD